MTFKGYVFFAAAIFQIYLTPNIGVSQVSPLEVESGDSYYYVDHFEIIIDKPISDVWPHILNMSSWMPWMEGVNNRTLNVSEGALISAFNAFSADSVTDLVLDLRYNGGGFLAIASQLAYMIAGDANTAGRIFETTQFSDKHPTIDPVNMQPITPFPFIDETIGFSEPAGQSLPTLDLNRVFILTGSETCSASESIINSLNGVGIEIVLIGATTCGKPFGFTPQDNCGTTYFTIQFQGVNDIGFGDYPDGFTPSNSGDIGVTVQGCAVADDISKELGDLTEARLAAALAWRASPTTCPAPPPVSSLSTTQVLPFELLSIQSVGQSSFIQNNRILGMP